MAVPVAATAATLAYLNARWRLPVDWRLGSSTAKALMRFKKMEKADRLNGFYLVEENAQNKSLADKPFVLYEDRSWTFKQFYDMVLRYAGWLHSVHNVSQGEIVAINFMNGPEILFLAMALWSLGAAPAFINYNLSGSSLAHSVRTSSARLMIVESEVALDVLTPETKSLLDSPTFRNDSFPLETVVLDQGLQTSIEYFKPYRAPDSARSGAAAHTRAALISTSGTTGLPKQAVVAWLRSIGGAMVAANICQMQPANARHPDTYFTAMPLYHGTAFVTAFLVTLVSSSTFAIGRRFSVSNFWTDVKRHRATCITYVGEALRYLVAAPIQPGEKDHRVRLAYGNGLRPDVWKKFKERFGIETIVEFYAATEGTFATWNVNRNEFSDGAIALVGILYGLLLSRTLTLVKVDWEKEEPWRDPTTGFCSKVAPGEPGEALAKLDPNDPRALFPGYHNNEKASQEKLLRDVFVKGDLYFRSGDVLRWDSEGRIWFSDRIGDTFRWKSENVSTMEVGEVVGYHPEVHEANIYGVSVPGHEGRAGCAALLLKDSALEEGKGGTTVKPGVLESLATYSRNSLQKASVPVFLRVVKEMAATGNNKSVKHALRVQGVDVQAIQDAGSGDQLYWLKPGAERYVKFGTEEWNTLNTGKAKL